jgi:hypothetical protein
MTEVMRSNVREQYINGALKARGRARRGCARTAPLKRTGLKKGTRGALLCFGQAVATPLPQLIR